MGLRPPRPKCAVMFLLGWPDSVRKNMNRTWHQAIHALLSALISLSLLLAVDTVRAEDPFSVNLLARDSLAGWDHGSPPPQGWTIQDGKLSGSQRATQLLSGWTLGNFELRLKWSVEDGGVWHIGLPRSPSGQGFDLYLAEQDRCGALLGGNRVLEAGQRLERNEAGHTTVIRRRGDRLSLLVDDRPFYEVTIPARWRFGLTLALSRGVGMLSELRLEEPAGRPIFNGRDLEGWWTPGNIESWPVIDGELVCTNRRGNYLRTDEQYANFTLSLECKMRRGGNSGIAIRTAPEGWPSGDGIELQLLDQPPGAELTRSSMMGMYGNLEPFARADRSEHWNRVVIKTDGYLVTAWVNGTLVQHANTSHLPELKHRHLKGWIGFQDHGAWIRVRNINVLEAPDGLGMTDWYPSGRERGSQLVLDRLMNSERLSAIDGIRSGAVDVRIDEAGETTLAELNGPGALVQIQTSGGDGELAFYFDREDSPRIRCAASELRRHLPPVGGGDGPLLTFVGYRRALRIVHKGDEPADYRFEFVTFPDGTPLETYSDRRRSIARGMLPALAYRFSQMDGGTHREVDPMPRFESGPKTIEPGESVTLLSLKDAGVARWLKLVADRSVLQDDDLWLEVTVDGRMQPAISAPARFLFPGMAAKRNWHNFVLVNRGGFTNLLAMPFSAGLTVSAANRGTERIENVAASVSVEPADSSETASRMSLHGLFQPALANGSTSPLFERSGAGRLVGLVYEHPAEGVTGTSGLVVDGHERPGWQAEHLSRLLGNPAEGDVWLALNGRAGRLAWRYFLLAPIEFRQSLVLDVPAGSPIGGRLALFYLATP